MKALDPVIAVMQSTGSPWAICGGWAVDLFLGRVTRAHKDVDVAIPRRTQLQVQARLLVLGWTLKAAHKSELSPWVKGEVLELPRHTIWARKGDEFFELLLNEWTETEFVYRRDSRIKMPVKQAICRDGDVQYLVPELVLLYKSSEPENEVNQHDLAVVLSALPPESKAWLAGSLAAVSPEHPWLLGELGSV